MLSSRIFSQDESILTNLIYSFTPLLVANSLQAQLNQPILDSETFTQAFIEDSSARKVRGNFIFYKI